MNPSATDDNDAGGDEMVILILIMIEMAHWLCSAPAMAACSYYNHIMAGLSENGTAVFLPAQISFADALVPGKSFAGAIKCDAAGLEDISPVCD